MHTTLPCPPEKLASRARPHARAGIPDIRNPAFPGVWLNLDLPCSQMFAAAPTYDDIALGINVPLVSSGLPVSQGMMDWLPADFRPLQNSYSFLGQPTTGPIKKQRVREKINPYPNPRRKPINGGNARKKENYNKLKAILRPSDRTRKMMKEYWEPYYNCPPGNVGKDARETYRRKLLSVKFQNLDDNGEPIDDQVFQFEYKGGGQKVLNLVGPSNHRDKEDGSCTDHDRAFLVKKEDIQQFLIAETLPDATYEDRYGKYIYLKDMKPRYGGEVVKGLLSWCKEQVPQVVAPLTEADLASELGDIPQVLAVSVEDDLAAELGDVDFSML